MKRHIDMKPEKIDQVQNSMGRMMFVALAVIFQVAWIVFLGLELQKYSVWISLTISTIALLIVLRIYGRHTNAAFKMPWIILILVFPVFGLVLYVIVRKSGIKKHMRDKFRVIDSELRPKLKQDDAVFQELVNEDLGIANQAYYIWNSGHFPVYSNTDVEFYAQTDAGLDAQVEAMKTAEHFIFMEYHAIEDSISFHKMLDVMKEKVKQGVEVRIAYDDVGSMSFINNDFIKRMEEAGIKCRVFNPMVPIVSVFMNNRDHRKITVIDNKIGFTGGYNLADKYFNLTHPYGHWKDTGIRLEGDAVRSLTLTFLEMWNVIEKEDVKYDLFLPHYNYQASDHSYVQPYADSPLDEEYLGENVYLNVIKNAKRYIYFGTPYLIISDEMTRELGLAAKRGIDVRIVTPGIPDKKMVYQVTRSHYAALAAQGVRIYEYTPGFLHEKQCVSDDDTATVGTINMDWRSLYLHFENGVIMHNCSCIADIKKDFEDTFEKSYEVTEDYKKSRPLPIRIVQCLLRLLAPIM